MNGRCNNIYLCVKNADRLYCIYYKYQICICVLGMIVYQICSKRASLLKIGEFDETFLQDFPVITGKSCRNVFSIPHMFMIQEFVMQ